jgi:hypothetical protein
MSRETLLQTNFNAGAMSPRLYGRSDFKKYGNAVATLSNWIPLAAGPAAFRPGTVYLANSYNSAKKSRVIPFRYNTEQAYVLEFSHLKMRVFKDRGVVQSGGVDYEMVTPYTEDDLASLSYCQDSDVMYLTLKNDSTPIKVLKRLAHDNWTLTDVETLDGPYLATNSNTAHLMAPSATTGNGITITASGGHTPFAATDVGRLIRIGHTVGSTTTWGYAKIVGFTSSTVVTADVKSDFGGTTAVNSWRLGAFSQTTGYPALVTMHEFRLVFANTRTNPNTVWLSESQGAGQEKVLFAPSAISGTVADSHSIFFPLTAGDSSPIMWMSSGSALAVGTYDSEWVIESGDNSKAISPSNSRATRKTNHGSMLNVPAVRIDGTVMYAKATGSRINRFVFDFSKDQYMSTNISLLAEHLFTGKTVKTMVYAPEPFSVIWVLFTDGTLASLTFVDAEEVGGWAEHKIAGGVVESITVIPATNASYSELYMVVQRTIDGNAVRYIEVMEIPHFQTAQEDAVYVDCSLKYDGAATTSITGLDHLEGETVTVYADGGQLADKTVSGGEIELEEAASVVIVGLYYEGDIKTLDFDAVNSFSGSSMGQIRRISQAQVRLFESGPVYTARSDQTSDKLSILEPRTADDNMDEAPRLKSGIFVVDHEGSWDLSTGLWIQARSPFPATVSALMFKAQVNEG